MSKRIFRSACDRQLPIRLFLFLIALLLLIPIVFTLLYSFFSPSEIKNYLSQRGSLNTDQWMPVLISPRIISIGQYYHVLLENSGILKRFLLSCFYTSAILLGQALFVPSLAYALSSFVFRGRRTIFFVLILFMLLPFQVTMVPSIIVLRSLNMLDTVWAVIVPMWFSPFYVFLIRQYMISIPHELFEASQLDGAGTIRCYVYIALPICRPVLGAAAALSFADSWNMVEQPMTFLSKHDELQPLSTTFNRLIATPSGIEFAGAVLYLLPALLIYLFFRQDIENGIHVTDIK